MTFTEFIIQKYPLWGDRDLHHLHITVQQMIDLVNEWQSHEKFGVNKRCIIHSYDLSGKCIACGHQTNLYFT